MILAGFKGTLDRAQLRGSKMGGEPDEDSPHFDN